MEENTAPRIFNPFVLKKVYYIKNLSHTLLKVMAQLNEIIVLSVKLHTACYIKAFFRKPYGLKLFSMHAISRFSTIDTQPSRSTTLPLSNSFLVIPRIYLISVFLELVSMYTFPKLTGINWTRRLPSAFYLDGIL
jgi:hypothetical protein